MRWDDPLYGPWDLPDAVARLLTTDRVVRMQDISQSVLPRNFEPYGQMPSRFEHGLGVCRLACEALKYQGDAVPERYHTLLPIAAFLHDCGNPPFSHMAEPFLEQDFRHDGESFLTAMLCGSQTGTMLEELGIGIDEITALVTGADMPFAEVLCGSLDLDNDDNVARYWVSATGTSAGYHPLVIARSYRFDPAAGRWALLASAYDQAQAWKKCREGIYGLIFKDPHWAVVRMLQRAIYLHRRQDGALPREFYFMTDTQATGHLAASPVPGTRELMLRAAHREWYPVAFQHVGEGEPPARLRELSADLPAQHGLTDRLACELGIPDHHVTAAMEVGRDRRMITIPFLQADGTVERADEGPSEPLWRVFVWTHPDHASKAPAIADFIRSAVF